MKFSFSTIALAASLAFVNAQDLTGIPTCALTCFATAVPDAGCSLTDTVCQCTTGREKITEDITACVPSKCDANDIASLAPAVSAICSRAGITISNVPTGVSTASGASATASGASTTATGSRTASASGAAQSTGAAVQNGLNFGLAVAGAAAMWF